MVHNSTATQRLFSFATSKYNIVAFPVKAALFVLGLCWVYALPATAQIKLKLLEKKDISCPGKVDGMMRVVVSSEAPPPFLFKLDDNQQYSTDSIVVFENLEARNYTVEVQDANQDIAVLVVSILSPRPPQIEILPTFPTCDSARNGSIDIVVTGGFAPYRFVLNGGKPTSEAFFDGLRPGAYSLKVIDIRGCEYNQGYFLPAKAFRLNATVKNPSCNENNGTISLSVIGGAEPLLYSINNAPFNERKEFTNLAPGIYYARVQDSEGCITFRYDTLRSTGEIAVPTEIVHPSCPGSFDGVISVKFNAGARPYQYSINNRPAVADSVFRNLNAGAYTIQVQDSAGCSYTTAVTLTDPKFELIIVRAQNPSCAQNNGVIEVNAQGGTAPYTYTLDTNPAQANGVFTNLYHSEFTIIARDAKGCAVRRIVPLRAEGDFNIDLRTKDPICAGEPTGEITVLAQNGKRPFRYSLNEGGPYQNDSTFTNLIDGLIQVFVIDADGCLDRDSVRLAAPATIGVSAEVSPTRCGMFDGKIAIIPVLPSNQTLAQEPYSIDGIDWKRDSIFTQLGPGEYTIYLKAGNGCVSTGIFSIIEAADYNLEVTGIKPSCEGEADGKIVVKATNGVLPFYYSLDGVVWQLDSTFEDLGAGQYFVYVKDATECQDQSPYILGEPPVINAMAQINSPACGSGDSATVTITATPASMRFRYSRDGRNWQDSPTFTKVPLGTSVFFVQNESGCRIQLNTTINAKARFGLRARLREPNCYNSTDGEVELSVTEPGTPPYRYGIIGRALTADSVIRNLSGGTYTIIVRDSQNCFDSLSVTLASGRRLSLAVNSKAPACGQNNGELRLSATGGSGAGYLYRVNNGVFSPNNSYTGLASGTTNITVQDGQGCSYDTTLILYGSRSMSKRVSTTNPNCGQQNGAITAVVNEGGSFSFSLDGFNFTNRTGQIIGLASGSYTLYIRDAQFCLDTVTVELLGRGGTLAAELSARSPKCVSSSDGSIRAAVAGGTAPYQYRWSSGDTSAQLNKLKAGTYTVTVIDATLCSAVRTATLTSPDSLKVSLSLNYGAGNRSASITVTATGGKAPYTFALDRGEFVRNNVFADVPTGLRRITVQDSNGCTTSDSILVQLTARTNDLQAHTINLYPNPTTGMLTIHKPIASIGVWQVVDYTGKTLFSGKLDETNLQVIDVSALPAGMYLLRFTNDTTTYNHPFIKQ